ncbi:MAG: DNA polymerase III subunit delta [Calditrichaceae bacterium]|nr:DNA polymerase III subunit delta [Calditrichaceae bacterium]MBN2708312.1 DNA polymerase III subunit delta [Calditrichaceae bacterium]RQV97233.1 MAG: DNA polymerase III subunit delta [Calditrichota bacterium]
MIDVKQAIAKFKAGKIDPVLYLRGEEKYYHDRLIQALISTLFKDQSSKDLNLHIFYGTEDSINDIISAVSSFPMFADFKLVIVRDFNQLTIGDTESFIKYLQKPQKSCCLVLSSVDSLKAEIEQALQAYSTIIECPKVRAWNLPEWIKSYCKENGYSINDQASLFLAEQTGEDLLALEQELKKIYSYKGEQKEITLADIEQTTGLTNDFDIFALQDAILEINFMKCLKISKQLLDSGYYIHPMIASLFTFFRKYLQVRLLSGRISDPDLIKKVQIREFQLKKYRKGFHNFTAEKIRQAIILLHRLDVATKSTNMDNFDSLQMYFYKICSK